MEEAALGVAHFLAILDLPLGLVGFVVGLATAVIRPGFHSTDLQSGTMAERIGVGLCGGVAFLGLLGFLLTGLRHGFALPPVAQVFVLAVLLCGLPAVLWKSPWRGSAEGIATAAVSAVAVMAGFSIGYLFVPLVALMIWICVERAWLTKVSKLAILLGLR